MSTFKKNENNNNQQTKKKKGPSYEEKKKGFEQLCILKDRQVKDEVVFMLNDYLIERTGHTAIKPGKYTTRYEMNRGRIDTIVDLKYLCDSVVYFFIDNPEQIGVDLFSPLPLELKKLILLLLPEAMMGNKDGTDVEGNSSSNRNYKRTTDAILPSLKQMKNVSKDMYSTVANVRHIVQKDMAEALMVLATASLFEMQIAGFTLVNFNKRSKANGSSGGCRVLLQVRRFVGLGQELEGLDNNQLRDLNHGCVNYSQQYVEAYKDLIVAPCIYSKNYKNSVYTEVTPSKDVLHYLKHGCKSNPLVGKLFGGGGNNNNNNNNSSNGSSFTRSQFFGSDKYSWNTSQDLLEIQQQINGTPKELARTLHRTTVHYRNSPTDPKEEYTDEEMWDYRFLYYYTQTLEQIEEHNPPQSIHGSKPVDHSDEILARKRLLEEVRSSKGRSMLLPDPGEMLDGPQDARIMKPRDLLAILKCIIHDGGYTKDTDFGTLGVILHPLFGTTTLTFHGLAHKDLATDLISPLKMPNGSSNTYPPELYSHQTSNLIEPYDDWKKEAGIPKPEEGTLHYASPATLLYRSGCTVLDVSKFNEGSHKIGSIPLLPADAKERADMLITHGRQELDDEDHSIGKTAMAQRRGSSGAITVEQHIAPLLERGVWSPIQRGQSTVRKGGVLRLVEKCRRYIEDPVNNTL